MLKIILSDLKTKILDMLLRCLFATKKRKTKIYSNLNTTTEFQKIKIKIKNKQSLLLLDLKKSKSVIKKFWIILKLNNVLKVFRNKRKILFTLISFLLIRI